MPITESRSMFQIAAAHRFPLSAAVGNIRGDGRYALVTKCSKRWRVLLFPTAEDRDAQLTEWNRNYCPSKMDCRLDHFAEDLHLR
jgi:hypothetical protein